MLQSSLTESELAIDPRNTPLLTGVFGTRRNQPISYDSRLWLTRIVIVRSACTLGSFMNYLQLNASM